MKNTRITLFVCLVLATFGLLGWETQHPTFSIQDGGQALRTFVISNNQLTPSSSPDDPSPRYNTYVFTGDGNFHLGAFPDYQSTSTPSWTYNYQYNYKQFASTQNYSTFIETTDVYDDGEDPPGFTPISIVTVSPGTNGVQKTNLGSNAIEIFPVRKMVPGHRLTYIIVYENKSDCGPISGNIMFTYQPSRISYNGYSDYSYMLDGTDNVTLSIPNGTDIGTVTIPFKNLGSGEQKTAFLNFTTIGTLHQPVIPPTAQMVLENKPNSCSFSPAPFTLTQHCTIESSHDPNHKTAFLEYHNNQPYLTYLIDFQNDGRYSAHNITLEDHLDSKLQNCSANSVLCTSYTNPSFIFHPNISSGKLTINLTNLDLKGLGDPTAFEPDTKGWVKIGFPLSCISPMQHCDAILNRTSIRFEHNPPIETNLEITGLNCVGNISLPDTSAPIPPPASIPLCLDSVFNLSPVTMSSTSTGTLINPVLASYLSANSFHCQWYPTYGLQNHNQANATVVDPRNITYTLVASKNCERRIYHVRVIIPCNIEITQNITTQTNGSSDVTLTATGSSNPLQWQDGTIGTTWTKTNLAPGKYYFSVYDEITGCYAEKWITLCGNGLTVDDTPGDCVANLSVSGGQAPYTYQWEWGGTAQGFLGPNLNLAGKSNVHVTVTDINGCSAVFSPVFGNCKIPIDWEHVLLVSAAVAAIIIGFYYAKLKTKK